MKLSEAVDRVISLAKTIREYWETELPKRHPDYPIVNAGEEALSPPPEEKKLAKFLAGLPQDLVYQIGLLMYLGRGVFGVSDLADYFGTLKENYKSSSDLAFLMAGKTTLADQLQEGLDELAKHNIDVDRLPLKHAKAHK